MARRGVTNGGLVTPTGVLNTEHPLSRGAVLALPFGNNGRGNAVRDLSLGKHHGTSVLDASTRAWTTGAGGMGSESFGSEGKINFGDGSFLPTGGATALVYYQKTDATNRSASLFSAGDTSLMRLLGPYSNGTLYWYYGSNTLSIAGLDYSDPTVIVVSIGTTRGQEIWQDGVRVNSNGGNQSTRSTTTGDFILGGGIGGFPDADLTRIYSATIWDRQLSEAEIVEASRDPWAWMRPGVNRVYFVPTGAVALTPAAATVTLAAQASTIAHAQSVSPAAATVSLTAQASTIAHAQGLDPVAATVTLTAQASTVAHALTLTPTAAATVTFAAQASVIDPVGPGSPVALDPVAATVSLTAQASTMGLAQSLTPAAATVGILPQISDGIGLITFALTVSPTAAAVTLTAQASAMGHALPLVPEAATVTITAQASTISPDYAIAPAAATISVTAQASTAGHTLGIAPIAATITVTAQASTVSAVVAGDQWRPASQWASAGALESDFAAVRVPRSQFAKAGAKEMQFA